MTALGVLGALGVTGLTGGILAARSGSTAPAAVACAPTGTVSVRPAAVTRSIAFPCHVRKPTMQHINLVNANPAGDAEGEHGRNRTRLTAMSR
ncbi:hypothetical protein [Streptosporangium sp. NPDC002721]|uniref:hypothetical protein n=1 Tax=Streptosporangium sp. NPDC002721 TaxID=3366188 RepID=UPI0036AB6FFA